MKMKEEIELEGFLIPFLSKGHLIQNKEATGKIKKPPGERKISLMPVSSKSILVNSQLAYLPKYWSYSSSVEISPGS